MWFWYIIGLAWGVMGYAGKDSACYACMLICCVLARMEAKR